MLRCLYTMHCIFEKRQKYPYFCFVISVSTSPYISDPEVYHNAQKTSVIFMAKITYR